MLASSTSATCSDGPSDGRSRVLVHGSIGEIAVFEILQMVDILSLKDVCVSLSEGRRTGRIWLHGERVLHASAGVAAGSDRWDLDAILERSPLTELDTLELLSALRGAGLIVAAA